MDWKTYCENRHISFPVIDSCAGLPIAMKYVYPLKQKIARDLYYMFQQDVISYFILQRKNGDLS